MSRELQSITIPILNYHGIAKVQGQASGGIYTILESQWSTQMEHLVQNQIDVISLERLGRWLSGREHLEKSVVITFDDGLESDFTIAFPLLKRHGFSATFFVNPGTVDQEGHLTLEQLQEMYRSGMEIGSHGYDHIFLTELDEKELEYQLVASKEKLETLLGAKVKSFSIPRGRYNSSILTTVKAAGYERVCTSDVGLNLQHTSPFRLYRWAIKRSHRLSDFASMTEGRMKKSLVFEHFLKRSAYQLLGHRLYEKARNHLLKEKE